MAGAIFIVLLIVSFAATDAYASIIQIISINFQGVRGLRTQVFFESANASTTRTPITVNTNSTVPAMNSSYRLFSGDSVYLWTPPFPSETIIHTASKMALDIWAGATPEINVESSSATLETGAGNTLSVALINYRTK